MSSPSWQMVRWPSEREVHGMLPSRAVPWSYLTSSSHKNSVKGEHTQNALGDYDQHSWCFAAGLIICAFHNKILWCIQTPSCLCSWDSISSATPFRSAAPGAHFPFPPTSFKWQRNFVITQLLGENLKNAISRKIFYRGNFILLDKKKLSHGTQ